MGKALSWFTSNNEPLLCYLSVKSLSCVVVSVIEGDAMSPDFIPSQPEGVYLYPFLQAGGSGLGAAPAIGAGLSGYPVFSFTWLQIQQIPGA